VTAFQAEYVDRKYIKTRLSYQLVFEVPAERIREVTAVLGELEGQQIWAAIARLADGAGSAPQASGPAPSEPSNGERIRTRAVMLCKDEGFIDWVAGKYAQGAAGEDDAISYLRYKCSIASRAELATNPEAQKKFLDLEARYRAETGRMAEKRGA
jgi:hypothetical protein